MIGIICAESQEMKEIIRLMDNKKKEKICSLNFTTGVISGKNCVAALSGVGKVNAAMCTQSMILKYNPDVILNVGVAGGISENISIGDIVIGKGVIQHDFDVSAFPGRQKGEISGLGKVEIPCTQNISDKLISASKNIKDLNTHYGTILTGDQFINSSETLHNLKYYFDGLACEMEAGSIGQVCFINNINFGVIKSISDTADSNSTVDFETFIKQSSKNCSKLLLEFIKLNQD